MPLPDGSYYIGSRESSNAYAIGSNEVYETIRTLPNTHSPYPWQVRRSENGMYVLTYREKAASSVSDAAVALVLAGDQATEWAVTPVGPENLYIIWDSRTRKAWYALDRGNKDIISLAHVDTRKPPPRALFEFSRVEF